MASLREMRLHIRSVKNIAQVTRALQTVSASKVRRSQAAMTATRPYAEKALEVLDHLYSHRGSIHHPLLTPRKRAGPMLVIVVSGDRGLAGAYNATVVRRALAHGAAAAAPVSYLVIGRRGRDMLRRRGATIRAEFDQLPAAPAYGDLSAIGRLAIEDYLAEKVDRVDIVYTAFVSMIQQRPTVRQLIPVPDILPAGDGMFVRGGRRTAEYLFEPGPTQLLDFILNRLISLEIYECILESLTSEHAARMVMMRNATDNAFELIHDLQLAYNKARQQDITGDLLDITVGTEALAGQGASAR
jgi:F-type H+-transporting ATPase subunit gamma